MPGSRPPRLSRELRTIGAMIRLYCRDHHGAAMLCPECAALYDYAACRLDRCPYGEEKPTCVNCPIHCYEKARREQVRTVMRYAGPRMLLRHPVLAVMHMIDGRKTPPPSPRKRAAR